MNVVATAHDGDFAFYLADIIVETIQYGDKTGLCNIMPGLWQNIYNGDFY